MHASSTVKDWNCPETRCDLESQYTDQFNELGLSAQVDNSTHRAGNILGQILTNKPNLVTNVAIEPDGICQSDHFTLNFEITKSRFKKKVRKRKIFAHKRADWANLSSRTGD